jgi:hypothetical protein
MDLPDFVFKSPFMKVDDPTSLTKEHDCKHFELKVFIS